MIRLELGKLVGVLAVMAHPLVALPVVGALPPLPVRLRDALVDAFGAPVGHNLTPAVRGIVLSWFGGKLHLASFLDCRRD